MPKPLHTLINGLSAGSGGGFTVARELWKEMAAAREDWRLTLCLIEGHSLHEKMRGEKVPANCQILWAPSRATSYRHRARYEEDQLPLWCQLNNVDAVVQLNGMIVPKLKRPTLAHFQDPWPYRPEAWTGKKDRIVAFFKRRRHLRTLQEAEAVSWTSAYLRDLICGRLGISPRRSEILYNGVPQSWIERAENNLPVLEGRPLEIVSVSNVNQYKRQELVIRALPAILKHADLKSVIYRIAGECPNDFRVHLTEVARQLGVEKHVVIEGRVSDARVQELLANSRCFVLMSVCESFGIPAVEAMTFGTPVITSDCCAMPEICGVAAVLSPMDDVDSLAKNIERVLLNADVAETLRLAGTQRVKLFNWQTTARRMAEVIESIAM